MQPHFCPASATRWACLALLACSVEQPLPVDNGAEEPDAPMPAATTDAAMPPGPDARVLADATPNVDASRPAADAATTNADAAVAPLVDAAPKLPLAPSSLDYADSHPTYTVNLAISPNIPSVGGGTPTEFRVTPVLPTGLALDATTGVLTGTPQTTQVETSYTVTAANAGGSASTKLFMTVHPVAPSGLFYPTSPLLGHVASAIEPMAPTLDKGGAALYDVVPALPGGLVLDLVTGVITGTPTTEQAETAYTITAQNAGGIADTEIRVTILPAPPTTLSYGNPSATYRVDQAIAENSPTVKGGVATDFQVKPALPGGLHIDAQTGVISGTPTAEQTESVYTVTASNAGGSAVFELRITVLPVAPAALSYATVAALYQVGTAIPENIPKVTGGAPTSYAVDPKLPAGLSLGASGGVISGTPTIETADAPYTVTASNAGGSAQTELRIRVLPAAPATLSYSSSTVTYKVNQAISKNSPIVTGGTPTAYAVEPAMPAGLLLDTTTGVITGTPTQDQAEAAYTVTASNDGGSAKTQLKITVLPVPPSSVTYSSPTGLYRVGLEIPPNTATTQGGKPTLYTVDPALPDGLAVNASTGLITGTPTKVQAQTSYTVTAQNAGGQAQTKIQIMIDPPPLKVTFDPATGYIGSKVTLTLQGFSGVTDVRFGNEGASFVVESDTKVVATVPKNSRAGSVSLEVRAASGAAQAQSQFTVLESFGIWREDRTSSYLAAVGGATGTFKTGQNADLMLSGVDFNKTGGALLFNHPCVPTSDGTRLLVADRNNNRVLIWSTMPTGNTAPDRVLGQPDFDSNDPGAGLGQMNWPLSVSLAGGKLVVSDGYNDRLLIWDTFPTANGQPADRTIAVEWPWGAWTNGTKLAATSTTQSKLLLWDTFPTTSNQAPTVTISGQGLGTPRTIVSNGDYIVVGDHNATVGEKDQMNFFWTHWPTVNDTPPTFYRKPLLDTNYAWMNGTITPDKKLVLLGRSLMIWNTLPTSELSQPDLIVGRMGTGSPTTFYDWDGGDGSGVTFVGDRVVVSGTNGNKMLVYNSLPTSGGQLPDYAIGAPDIHTNTLLTNGFITNPLPATDGKSLFVASDFDRALYVWKRIPDQSGAAPDYIFHTPFQPFNVTVSGGKLMLLGEGELIVWNTLPTDGAYPDKELKGFIGSVEVNRLTGLAWDGTRLSAASRDTGKVHVWTGVPAATDEPVITVNVGQPGHLYSNGTHLAVTQTFLQRVSVLNFSAPADPPVEVMGFNLPAAALLGPSGQLFVANTVHHRVEVWNSFAAATGKAPDIVLGEIDAKDNRPEIGRNKVFWPASLALDSSYLWVGEFKFSGRLLRYSISP